MRVIRCDQDGGVASVPTEGSPRGRSPMIHEILRYLIEHPDAKDTIDGILRWWIPQGHAERKKEDVEHAINELVAKGWIVKRETTPSHTVYGVDKHQLEQVRNFLASETIGNACDENR